MLKLKPSLDRWPLDVVLIGHHPNDAVDPIMFKMAIKYASF